MNAQTSSNPHEHEGYHPGHPWYYYLGGKPLSPREILEATRHSGYLGYARERIANLDHLSEPKRSQSLRAERDKFRSDLREDIHVALSLKHNHMVNNFGHLILLDELLSKQKDLFDF